MEDAEIIALSRSQLNEEVGKYIGFRRGKIQGWVWGDPSIKDKNHPKAERWAKDLPQFVTPSYASDFMTHISWPDGWGVFYDKEIAAGWDKEKGPTRAWLIRKIDRTIVVDAEQMAEAVFKSFFIRQNMSVDDDPGESDDAS